MAPQDFESQTNAIISCLFLNERDIYETDGPGSLEDENADAMKIAEKLRQLGDLYDETVIQPLIKEVRTASKQQVVTAFSNGVDSLSKMWVAERAEVVPEKHLLKATITLALYMKKNCPDVTGVQEAVVSFVNNRLASWIIQQGGWEKASFSCD
ncbi:bcl-2-like protein 15 [Colossoma macropomum]|uniref:bcl-2-like protein 15 n=1 Tax=Colossoma macropomum TaxID=42526 RepID=UPI00186525B4|nr:bcl-2-like protein 15 [Colossoma macropomum]